MTLTPEEQRAVEAACGWDRNVRSTTTPSEQRLVTGVKAQMIGRAIEAQMVVGGCAIGYLAGDRDGYRRGVEAALKVLGNVPARDPGHYDGDNHGDSFNNGYERAEWSIAGALRALLAQEEPS